MAVATLWTITIGTDIDPHYPHNLSNELSPNHLDNKLDIPKTTVRKISCFLQGLIHIQADLLNGKAISLTGLKPQRYQSISAAANTS
jgi:hypothetical protein